MNATPRTKRNAGNTAVSECSQPKSTRCSDAVNLLAPRVEYRTSPWTKDPSLSMSEAKSRSMPRVGVCQQQQHFNTRQRLHAWRESKNSKNSAQEIEKRDRGARWRRLKKTRHRHPNLKRETGGGSGDKTCRDSYNLGSGVCTRTTTLCGLHCIHIHGCMHGAAAEPPSRPSRRLSGSPGSPDSSGCHSGGAVCRGPCDGGARFPGPCTMRNVSWNVTLLINLIKTRDRENSTGKLARCGSTLASTHRDACGQRACPPVKLSLPYKIQVSRNDSCLACRTPRRGAGHRKLGITQGGQIPANPLAFRQPD